MKADVGEQVVGKCFIEQGTAGVGGLPSSSSPLSAQAEAVAGEYSVATDVALEIAIDRLRTAVALSTSRSVETPHRAVPTSDKPVGFLCPMLGRKPTRCLRREGG